MQCHRLIDQSVSKLLRRPTPAFSLINQRGFIKVFWVKFERWQDRVKETRQEQHEAHLQKKWVSDDVYLTPERPEDVLPKRNPLDMTIKDRGGMTYDTLHHHAMIRYFDWSPANIARYNRAQNLIALQYDQRFIPERQLMLGPDLAAAHFVLHRGGAVKFVGDEEWHKQNKYGEYVLPGTRIPGMYVEAINASGTKLMFEGFDNIVDLTKLRLLSLADCVYINDWCIGKMTQFENSLEFLDLSNCKKLTANGLSGLACLKHLRFLRLDGLDHVKDLAKVTLLLEEAIPGLQILGVNYDLALESLKKEEKLLSHPNVVQDARGNMFLKDEIGETYYLYGNLREKHVIDDFDEMPLLVSTIRKDPPVLPLETSEEINRLSGGKLKHLLAGSPSGEWTQETERVLQVDTKRLLDQGHAVHPFLHPVDKRSLAKRLDRLKAVEEKLFLAAKSELEFNARHS